MFLIMAGVSRQEGFEILKTPGSTWCQIDLDSSMSGATCTLVFNSPVGNYNYLGDIYLLENQYVDTIRFEYLWTTAISLIILFVFMLMALLLGIFNFIQERRKFLLLLAQYISLVILWVLAELNVYDIFFSRPIVSYLLGEVFRRMVPIAFIYFVHYSMKNEEDSRVLKVLKILCWLNLIVPFVLLFSLGIPLIKTKFLEVCLLVIVSISLLIVIGKKCKNYNKLEYEEYHCLAFLILIITNTTECLNFYFCDTYQSFMGMRIAIGASLYCAVTFAIMTYISAHIAKAITSFASYMRKYLVLIRQRVNIPFVKELELVEGYLRIQQMRLGSRLDFTFDAEVLDFQIPPFVVHTVIENAIVHGISKKNEGGTINISTKLHGDYIEIVISDTGIGFDVDISKSETSVGLENARKRLEIMRKGSLTIDSNIGEGTVVTITVPVEE